MPRRAKSTSTLSARIATFLTEEVEGLLAIYLFGSMADGRTHAESDVDVAILLPRPLDNVDRWDLQEALASHLGRDVDLVDLRRASTVMQMQVVSKGRLIYDRDVNVRQHFEVFVYSSYALLNEERREIIEDIKRRGRVYG